MGRAGINSMPRSTKVRRHRRGAMIVAIAISLPILLIMAALAVNVAHMELTRTELRAATDFASRAGARRLSMTGNTMTALAEIQTAANRNRIGGQPLSIASADVQFGTGSKTSNMYTFQPGGANPNAVEVFGRVQGGQAIALFLGGVFGQSGFEPSQRAVAAQIDRDIAVVLDRSGSMASRTEGGQGTGWVSGDPAPANSRWVKALSATTAFFASLQATPMDEKLSLVTYSATALTDSELTFNYSSFAATLDVYTQAYVTGMTNISDGIEEGRQTLVERGNGRPWAQKTIVVLTDGIHNAGTIAPVDAALAAAASGVIVHTITFGNDADQTAMAAVASAGNGQHWHAPNQSQLIVAFNEIANNSPTMLIE